MVALFCKREILAPGRTTDTRDSDMEGLGLNLG